MVLQAMLGNVRHETMAKVVDKSCEPEEPSIAVWDVVRTAFDVRSLGRDVANQLFDLLQRSEAVLKSRVSGTWIDPVNYAKLAYAA